MRTIQSLAIVLFVLAFSACRKNDVLADSPVSKADNAAPVGISNATDTIGLTIEGANWSDSRSGMISAAMNDKLVINAANPDSSVTVGLILPSDIKPGTYALQSFSDYMGVYSKKDGTSYLSDKGSVTILERDEQSKKIKGTFEFKGSDLSEESTATVSNGRFIASWQ